MVLLLRSLIVPEQLALTVITGNLPLWILVVPIRNSVHHLRVFQVVAIENKLCRLTERYRFPTLHQTEIILSVSITPKKFCKENSRVRVRKLPRIVIAPVILLDILVYKRCKRICGIDTILVPCAGGDITLRYYRRTDVKDDTLGATFIIGEQPTLYLEIKTCREPVLISLRALLLNIHVQVHIPLNLVAKLLLAKVVV